MKWFHRKHVKLTTGKGFELKAGRKYLLVFSEEFLTSREAMTLSRILRNKGIKDVTCVRGHGTADDLILVEDDRG